VLPIVVDPSHSAGVADLVPYQFCGASVYRANGALVEVIADETDRKTILCDARQGIRLNVFERLVRFQLELERIHIGFEE
jgi:3-deoxy-D-arabino-heptulosonate 7-phosphate (DAHP) synthase